MMLQFLRLLSPVSGPALLVVWLHFAGTYSMARDIAGIGLVSAAMIAIRFYRKRRLAPGTSASIGWRASSFFPAWRFGPSLAWALLCWLVLGSLDQLFESTPVPRRGMKIEARQEYKDLRVGLALSGGGYRAALVHAGVLDILARRGVPVTNLSTVSGGSIIGSFIASGGNPRDFEEAVAGGRFRLSRDMLDFQNAARILASTPLPVLHVSFWPFETFTTRSVQANLVDRVLLNGVNASGMEIGGAPLIMVCMTDLTYALAVGAMPDGLLLAGPTQKRFFKEGEALQLEGLNRLADRVAVSGGFPGVFPALKARATLVTFPWSIPGKDRSETLSLTLADGGIRDNLGLTLLDAANDQARNPPDTAKDWKGYTPDPKWKVDLMVISDGGKFLEATNASGLFSEIMRAIDISGLETGVERPIQLSDKLPKTMLSPLSIFALSPDSILLGTKYDELKNSLFSYFSPTVYNDELLSAIISLLPNQDLAQTRLRQYLAARTSNRVNLTEVRESCVGKEPAPAVWECAWWGLVSTVGDDMWRTMTTFAKAATLEDLFSAEDTAAIFRFGQYMTLLKWPEIEEGLLSVAPRKGQQSPDDRTTLPPR